MPIKGKSKTAKKRTRNWIDIERGNYSFSAYEISKKVIHLLLRHSQIVQREEDGAVQFWRIKNYLKSQFPQLLYWSDDRWKACLAAGGRNKIYLRALQVHSGRNLIYPSLQDDVVIQSGFFHHIYILDVRLIFILSSTLDWFFEVRIQARDRQYSSCLLIPETKSTKSTKSTKILKRLTWMYLVVQNTCIKHGRNTKTRYIGSILIVRFGKDWPSIRLDRMQSYFKNTSSLLYSKNC